MQVSRSRVRLSLGAAAAAVCSSVVALLAALTVTATLSGRAHGAESTCRSKDSGLTLPAGFCVTIFADGIGHARHMVLGPGGVIYANTWSGRYYVDPRAPEGGFLVAMKDTDGDGNADVIERFGATPETGGKGGTGIGLYKGSLYAEINDRIVRYELPRSGIVPTGAPITVVKNLPLTGNHPAHPFVIDAKGNLYVTSASATNACQKEDRKLYSPGLDPCTELETRAGFWLYDARKADQTFSPAERYATGNRNGVGFAIDPARRIYVSQHGRDQIHANWPEVFQPEEGATLPAEEVMVLERGADYGWPMCYFDPKQKKRLLGPEYGGDGKKEGACVSKTRPAAYFPAHWAPNALLFYSGGKFPDHYRNGLFIAFHGSWNRAPFEQGGYSIVFQPMKHGRAAGQCEIFADGFAGAIKQPGQADHRPTGLVLDADGALLISDDAKGRIYRVTYHGPKNADASALGAVACPPADAPAGTVVPMPEDPRRAAANAPMVKAMVPQGFTAEQVDLGRRIYHGQLVPATCVGCHGPNGAGTPLGPNLGDSEWLWSDGSVAGIAATITQGVMEPKQYRSGMPAMGGTQLTADQVNAISAYLWGLSHATSVGSNAGEILIPGERVFPESVTSSADGRLFVGSIAARTIYSAAPGDKEAKPWIEPGDETRAVIGVFADDRSNTLWACYSAVPKPKDKPAPRATLKAFDLTTAAAKGSYAMPTDGALCNDIAVDGDGTVYVSDSNNMEIVRLDKRAKKLTVWAGDGALGPKGGVLDGIAVLGDRILINTLGTGKLFGVPIGKNGAAGPVTEIDLGRKLVQPDGMRSAGADRLLVVEGGDVDRLSSIKVADNRGEITVIKEGYSKGPVSVAVVGSKAWVVEGQFALLFGKADPNAKPDPFKVTAVELRRIIAGLEEVTIEPARRMRGKGFEWDHEIQIALPASYGKTNRSYPVLWVTDGSAYFELAVKAVNYDLRRHLPEMIVVAIGAPPEEGEFGFGYRRSYEFLPSPVRGFTGFGGELLAKQLAAAREQRQAAGKPNVEGGGAAPFLAFLVDEVRATLSREYRMAADHALFGDSGGGVFCTYALLARPEAFSKYICGSPNLYAGDFELFRMEERYAKAHEDLKATVFFGAGEAEILEKNIVPAWGVVSATARMAEILSSRNYPSLKLYARIFPSEDHASVVPLNLSWGLRAVWQDNAR